MTHDLIVVGASAGGVEALTQLVRQLPEDLGAAVFVVLHVSPHGTSVLPSLLARAGPLPAHHAEDGETYRPGCIYVARPDHHLLVDHGKVRVVRGPSENGHRPAIDPLFRSAALTGGRRVVGVILSGLLDDGTSGLHSIKSRGGITLVQDPREALFTGMPQSAINRVGVDAVLPIAEIAKRLAALSLETVDDVRPAEIPGDTRLTREVSTAEMIAGALDAEGHPGTPSMYSCPGCNGVLWEIKEGAGFRFRCRTGHAYSLETLLSEQSRALDEALWMALRALEESASLSDRLAGRARERGHDRIAALFTAQSETSSTRAETIRQALLIPNPEAVYDNVS